MPASDAASRSRSAFAARKRSLIATANEVVSIISACQWIGMDVPEEIPGGSAKVHCPFGEIYHSDRGAETSFRVYPGPNNAWCFACSQFFTPVSLCTAAWGGSPEETAVDLLARVGWKPATYAHLWAEARSAPPVDRDALAGALTTWCVRVVVNWDERQYEEPVAEYLARCLGLLSKVRTASDAVMWLDGTKRAIRRFLGIPGEENGDG